MENKTAKHTPGPWRVGGGDGNLIFAPDGCVIAQADACDAKHFKEDIPNARLIASAPELAKEIRNQLGWLKHARSECAGVVRESLLLGFDQSIKYLSAVLAKAEGH